MSIEISAAEREVIESLANLTVEPGTRCPVCNRRVNKPRKETSPDAREMRIKLPSDRMEWLEEALDTLQQYVGADPYSYPRGALVEAVVQLGIQQREEVKAYFKGTE